jgi:hypothetical protein
MQHFSPLALIVFNISKLCYSKLHLRQRGVPGYTPSRPPCAQTHATVDREQASTYNGMQGFHPCVGALLELAQRFQQSL